MKVWADAANYTEHSRNPLLVGAAEKWSGLWPTNHA